MQIRKASSFVAKISQTGLHILNAVMPPHSLITGTPIKISESEQDVALWQALQFLDAPCCDACGFPFEFDQGVDALCARCHGRKPITNRVRSAIVYDDTSRKLVLDFKYGGRTDGLQFFAAQMNRAGQDLLHACDFMIPVPLHKDRLRQRRFNQSALLARTLSKRTGLMYQTDVLLRNKNTPSQGGLTFAGRRKNVSGAFRVEQKYRDILQSKHILLIDDVYTTGATLGACAHTLLRAGASKVDALTLLRVVRAAEPP